MRPVYSVTGTIVHGKRLGRRLGFPTANMAFEKDLNAPENGVYVARMRVHGLGAFYGVLNQGAHPTFPEGMATIEMHLFDVDADLYGLEATAEYLRFLRPEMRFATADALKAQVAHDIARARAWLDEHGMIANHPMREDI